MERIKEMFNDWSLYEKVWLILFTIITLGLSLYWKDSAIGLVASLTGIWCVLLVAKGKISNYYFGIINAIAYGYVAYGQNYFGEVMLNIGYFLPMQFLGIYLWNKHKDSKDEVVVKSMSNRDRAIWLATSFISIIVYGFVLKGLGGNLPFIDSISTVLSVIAMILMAKRYLEQWALWIIIDIASIVLWFTALGNDGDISVLIMWISFLINAVYGMFNWIKLSKQQGVSDECTK